MPYLFAPTSLTAHLVETQICAAERHLLVFLPLTKTKVEYIQHQVLNFEKNTPRGEILATRMYALDMKFSDFASMLKIERELRSFAEALESKDPKDKMKTLKTYNFLNVTYKNLEDTVKQTKDAKEECHTRTCARAKTHKKFMRDLDTAWGAYDALVIALEDIEMDIEGWSQTNPASWTIEENARRTRKLTVLRKEYELAQRTCESSDKLCADMTDLAEQQREELSLLQEEYQHLCDKLEWMNGELSTLKPVMERAQRDIAPLLEAVEV